METEIVQYDEEADVLYLWSEDPSDVEDIIAEETGEEILIKRNEKTGEKIGVTIMHLTKRDNVFKGIEIPSEVPVV